VADRLEGIVDALCADPPRAITLDDATELAAALAAETDRGTALRADAAASAGLTIACAVGCTSCCEEPILVGVAETQRVARWLAAPERADARAAFVAAYPRWRAAVADGPERLADLVAAGAHTEYRRAHDAERARRALCAFNSDGRCTIYPVRPLVCRTAHALDSAERCAAGSTRAPKRLGFVPLDEFVANAARLLKAAHAAAGGARDRPAALCAAVYQILDEKPR
jgi:Fe-S-cluster containining protein